MSLINRNTDNATRAICFMAKNNRKRTSVVDLVRELRIPRPFLRKILQILNKKGILKSYKGKDGGFLLVDPPDKIFLIDLMNIFQGKLKLNDCLFKKRICPNIKTCSLREKLGEIEEYVVSELESINIASLLK
jgi:Rrf2 family cysteine metabolism transcriptional repressor